MSEATRQVIRHVEQDDLDAVVHVNRQSSEWVGDRDRGFFERYLHLPCFYALEEHGTVRAFVLAMHHDVDHQSDNFRWFRERFASFCYVDRIVIDQDLRRQGRGRRLYHHLIQHKGPVPLVCEVSMDPENTESIHFHDALGFKQVGVFTSGGKTCRMYFLPDAEGS